MDQEPLSREEEIERAVAAERALIVRWLRDADSNSHYNDAAKASAFLIERGDHTKWAAAGEPPSPSTQVD